MSFIDMEARGWLVAGFGLAATAQDLKSRQISNWISGGAVVAGLALHTIDSGWRGMGSAALGTLIGFGVFLIFYLMGGRGGGDIKLMAGFGALLGPGLTWTAALLTSIVGGIYAVVYLAVKAIGRRWKKRELEGTEGKPGGTEGAPRERETIPYAPAIAVGALLASLSAM